MKKLILALMVFAAPVQAIEWPWQTQTKEDYGYCKGFISSGLAAHPMKGMSRTQLWLSWNQVIQAGFASTDAANAQYSEGKSKFDTLLAANDTQSLVNIANGECDLGDS
tara:strand:- start:68717 stop:69043 length:327 start_codon:yes stop_codon:yes gene_type:complete